MRVLLIKTSSLGDVIHTLPALTDAARAIPGIQFDWVVEEGFAEIPAWHPAVAHVIPVAIRRWRKNLWQTLRSGEWRRFKRRLREARYDLVIDAQGLVKSALLTRYTKAPVVGLDRDSAREPLASRFYDRRYPVAWGQHAVERVRQLFAQALDYPLPEGVGNYGLNRAQLADAPGGAPYLLFLHGTTWDTKHWPEKYWRELAERACDHGWHVRLPWGNPTEKARAERIAEGLEKAAVLPKLSLAGMAKVVAGARACVAVDTGLGHLAAALDVPTLSLYGPTNPGFTGAYGRSQIHLGSDFPCAPCLKKTCAYKPTAEDLRLFDLEREQPLCFTRLNPQRVATQLEALLLTEDIH
ncbi:lipopolysaccharide heptosyltransferase I [Metapseudomonas lalkuanensis]|uniref:Lipopolysaccharide heptosyltransferase 1 n=1 Tax=Metapseudomonas lalkuanensis TaxID=2604832 RepID=A0A5J6QWN0_9GAMM|nr:MULTISPECIES: lipopolysaccharide heptosyltransferase I [Pseudomonas]MDH4874749.1 lipopolysaccharide heptosyltransferase I [Pseudomonas sp. BN515]QEY65276.1 lipopolysaccharide heptosyltransferase I [Pseudomonas lalkuanensis]